MKYEHVNLASLELDPKNPRLPLRLQNITNLQKIVDWMLTDASLIELMLAIGSNGFFPGEPLLVVKEGSGKFIVVEGNRRLASLLLLNDIVEPTIQIGSVRQVKDQTSERPNQIPVIIFDDRKEIEKYLGFRHVTGVKEWSPLAKARYLKSVMSSIADGEVTQKQYRELAKQIGSKRPYVQRLIVSYDLYELIEREQFYNIPDLNEDSFHFTYLMDSLNRSEIREFIGIHFDSDIELSKLDHDKFRQLIGWFFLKRPNGRSTMNASSSQLAKFCAILIHSGALKKLYDEGDLDRAYELTVDKEVSYRELISLAENNLKDALVGITDVENFIPADSESLNIIIKYSNALLKQVSND